MVKNRYLQIALIIVLGIILALGFIHYSDLTKNLHNGPSISYSHASFIDYSEQERYLDSAFIGIVKIDSWEETVRLSKGGSSFTPIMATVEQRIYAKEKDQTNKLVLYHEGTSSDQYDNFKLPQVGTSYFVFLKYSDELQGYQIFHPSSILEVVNMENGTRRVIDPNLKEAFIQFYGHDDYSRMNEFKDNQYATLKSGEKIKVDATKSLSDMLEEVSSKIIKYKLS